MNIDLDTEEIKLITSVADPSVKLEVPITVTEKILVDPEQITMIKGNTHIGEGRSTENISTLEMITGGRKLHNILYLGSLREDMFRDGS